MQKQTNINFKRRWIVAGLAAIAATVIVPFASSSAMGPERTTYTMKHPADHVQFNSLTDNNTIGDERDFVRVREVGTSKWTNTVKVTAGKEYEVFTFYHNNAASNLNASGVGVAVEASVWSVFPGKINSTTKGQVKSWVYAFNAKPQKVWDEAYFTTDSKEDITFRYLADTAKIYNGGKLNGTTLGRQLFKADGKDSENGILLGYNSQSGKLLGCMEYSGYIIYRVRAEQAGSSVSKTVSLDGKDFFSNVTAKPGDTVTYKVTFKNTGTKDLTNVTFRDQLPDGVTLVAGSAKLTASTGKTLNVSDAVVVNGVNVGKMSEGVTGTLTYKVKLNTNIVANGKCGTNSFKNLIRATTDQTGTKTGEATIKVEKICEEESPNFTIEKKVQLKGGNSWEEAVEAKADAQVRFMIEFKNTGNVELKNVIIRDTLPSGMTYENGSTVLYNNANKGGKTLGDGIISKSGINIGTVAKGETAVIYFYAKVNKSYAESCKAATLTNVAQGVYNADNDTVKEDSAKVNVPAGKKDCSDPEPEPDPEDECHDENGNVLKECCDRDEYKNEKICKDEPEVPTPEELPKTGPGEIALAIMAVVCVVTGGVYLYRSQQEVSTLQKKVKGHKK